jgi:hypothetical protein
VFYALYQRVDRMLVKVQPGSDPQDTIIRKRSQGTASALLSKRLS